MNLVRIARASAGLWTVHSPFHEGFIRRAKEIPGMRWEAKQGAWIGYSDSVKLLIERLDIDGIGKCTQPPPSVEPNRTAVDTIFPPGFQAREYQKDSINFLLNTAPEGALLADGMGVGKTLPTLLALQQLEAPAMLA